MISFFYSSQLISKNWENNEDSNLPPKFVINFESQSCTDVIFPLHSEWTGPFGGTALILGIIITLKDLIDVLNFLKYYLVLFIFAT